MRRLAAFGSGAAVGSLGGLIGLGGAEFRLPLLMGPFGLSPHRAVPLNLLISLATIVAALAFRLLFLPDLRLTPFALEIASLTIGAVAAAWWGAGLLHRLPARTLTCVIAGLLLALAALMLMDAAEMHAGDLTVPAAPFVRAAIGLGFGLMIGLVSSLLGVAGGELIIPTLVVAFGMDIVSAGTASLLISLPTVLVGVAYHARRGAFHGTHIRQVAIPMAAGSVFGALAGAYATRLAPAAMIKALLGIVLAASGLKIMRNERMTPVAEKI